MSPGPILFLAFFHFNAAAAQKQTIAIANSIMIPYVALLPKSHRESYRSLILKQVHKCLLIAFQWDLYEPISKLLDNETLSLWERVAEGRVRVPSYATALNSPHPNPLPEGEGELLSSLRVTMYIIPF